MLVVCVTCANRPWAQARHPSHAGVARRATPSDRGLSSQAIQPVMGTSLDGRTASYGEEDRQAQRPNSEPPPPCDEPPEDPPPPELAGADGVLGGDTG